VRRPSPVARYPNARPLAGIVPPHQSPLASHFRDAGGPTSAATPRRYVRWSHRSSRISTAIGRYSNHA